MSNINKARAMYYNFLSGVFLDTLLRDREEILKSQLMILASNPLKDELAKSFEILQNELDQNGIKNLLDEYTNLFILPFTQGGEIVKGDGSNKPNKSKKPKRINSQVFLYLSHYLEGCLNGESLVKARRIIKKSTKRLNRESFKESEEHLGFLFAFMESMLQDNNLALSKECFNELISPMATQIRDAILSRKDVVLYHHIAKIMDSFIELESMGNK